MSAGLRSMTISPFSLPLYWSRSAGFWMSSTMTSPVTSPLVPLLQPKCMNADAFLDRAGDLGGFQSARPAMRDLRGLQMRVDAVVLEALQCPVAGCLHLRRAGEPSADLRGQIFQVLHQLGVGLHFGSNLLVGLLHRFAIGSALLGGTLRGSEWAAGPVRKGLRFLGQQ